MSRVILYRFMERPGMTGSCRTTLDATWRPCTMLWAGRSCLPLDNGIQLWCHRDGLVSGLAVTRRVLAMSLDELGQFEIALGVGDLASPIFFSRSSNATGFDIYVAHRLSTSDGFGTPVAVTELCRARRRGKQAIRWPRL